MPEADVDARADDRFVELVTRYFNDLLREDELATLCQRLESEPSARKFFVQVARLDGLLTERSLTGKDALPIAGEIVRVIGASVDEDPPMPSLDDATVLQAIRESDLNASVDIPVTLPIFGSQSSPASPARTRIFARLSIAAVILLVGLSAAIWILQSPRHTDVSRTTPKTGLLIMPRTAVAEIKTVHVAASVRALWDSTSPVIGDEVPNRPLYLKSGWIRLDFPSGVTAVVEAPARFQVRSASEVNLELGSISAHVPQAGHGFSVLSRACRLVDLGTEFGMSVDPQGNDQVQVFQGKVSLSRHESSSTSAPTTGPAPEFLIAGEGRRIDSASISSVPIPAAPNSFVRIDQFNRWVTAQSSSLDKLRAFDEQLMRDPSLMLFYTLDDGDEHILVNHAAATFGQYDLSNDPQHGPEMVEGRISGISAMDFDPSERRYLVLPKYPITQTGMLSCAVWVYARGFEPYASILKNWGDTKCGSLHLGMAAESHHLEVELDGTRHGGPVVSDPEDFPTEQWVHVAFVSDGKTVRLYKNGKQVASSSSRPIPNDPAMTSLAIGCKTGDDGASPATNVTAGFWNGQIGEISLFNRVLTPDEIRIMSEQGR